MRTGRSAYCGAHKHPKTRASIIRESYCAQSNQLIGRSWIDNKNYRIIRWAGKNIQVHQLIDAITNGPIPKGWHVHHKDENTLHNHWDNLQRMPAGKHRTLHAQL